MHHAAIRKFFVYCFSILGTVGSVSPFHVQPHQSQWHVARAAFSPGPSVFPWLFMVESARQRAHARNREVRGRWGPGQGRWNVKWGRNGNSKWQEAGEEEKNTEKKSEEERKQQERRKSQMRQQYDSWEIWSLCCLMMIMLIAEIQRGKNDACSVNQTNFLVIWCTFLGGRTVCVYNCSTYGRTRKSVCQMCCKVCLCFLLHLTSFLPCFQISAMI